MLVSFCVSAGFRDGCVEIVIGCSDGRTECGCEEWLLWDLMDVRIWRMRDVELGGLIWVRSAGGTVNGCVGCECYELLWVDRRALDWVRVELC